MTFGQLFTEAKRLLPDTSIAVSVEAWHHRHDDGDTESVMFSIWDGTRHHEGRSPEAALHALRKFLDLPELTPDEVAL